MVGYRHDDHLLCNVKIPPDDAGLCEYGVDAYFDISIINEDPSSATGKQTVFLHKVNLNKVIIGKLDTESEALEEELEFTFEGLDIAEQFSALS